MKWRKKRQQLKGARTRFSNLRTLIRNIGTLFALACFFLQSPYKKLGIENHIPVMPPAGAAGYFLIQQQLHATGSTASNKMRWHW
jgi:hypothetical protein